MLVVLHPLCDGRAAAEGREPSVTLWTLPGLFLAALACSLLGPRSFGTAAPKRLGGCVLAEEPEALPPLRLHSRLAFATRFGNACGLQQQTHIRAARLPAASNVCAFRLRQSEKSVYALWGKMAAVRGVTDMLPCTPPSGCHSSLAPPVSHMVWP
jgi:hypothetical protein